MYVRSLSELLLASYNVGTFLSILRLYTWGSAAHGKLGMGECGTDSYTATPGKVPLGFGNVRLLFRLESYY